MSEAKAKLRDANPTKYLINCALAGIGGLVALHTLWQSFVIVPAQSYGVDVKLGQLNSTNLKPGIYGKLPYLEEIYVLNNNTMIWETENVGTPKNTSDQNSIVADFRFHVKINPKVGSLALTINKVASERRAENTLKDLQNQALDASVGKFSSSATEADPKAFLERFKANLEWRIQQNNLPIEIDAVELLEMRAGGPEGATSGQREVIQLRIRSDNTVEEMAGPAAIPVPAAGGGFINPPQKTFSGPATGSAPGASTGGKPPAP